mgnify:CR=1 FL=1
MKVSILYLMKVLLFIGFSCNLAAAQIKPIPIKVGGVDSVLIKPEKPIASVILLAGGDGRIEVQSDGSIKRWGNQLVRTRYEYSKKGFAVLVPDQGYNLSELVEYMKNIKRPVTVVGTSSGTQKAARGLYKGAKPDKLVLTAGVLSNASGHRDNVINIIETPDLLPPTLVIHHRYDHCKNTLPDGVPDFITWSKGKAKVIWVEGGEEVGDYCEAQAYHGFRGIDQKIVELVSQFAK